MKVKQSRRASSPSFLRTPAPSPRLVAAPSFDQQRAPSFSLLQRQAEEERPDAGSVDVAELGPGSPLDAQTAARMGTVFDAGFGDVSLHTAAPAAAAARALGADAIAVGRHLAFAPGAFRPGTPAGDGLIAHELAHVVQQRRSASPPAGTRVAVRRSEGHEREAQDAAHAAIGRLHGGGGAAEANAPPAARPVLSAEAGVQCGAMMSVASSQASVAEERRRREAEQRAQPVVAPLAPQPAQAAPAAVPQAVQQAPQPAPPGPQPAADRLPESVDLPDDAPPTERAYSHSLRQLHEVGARRPLAQPLAPEHIDAAIAAVRAGTSDFSRAGPTRLVQQQCEDLTRRAHAHGYDVSHSDVRTALSGLAGSVATRGEATTIGGFRGEWRGGGFYDFDQMRRH